MRSFSPGWRKPIGSPRPNPEPVEPSEFRRERERPFQRTLFLCEFRGFPTKSDLREAVELRSQGWHVIKIWECQLKPKVRTATLTSLEYTLNCIFLMNHGAKEHSEAKPYEEAKSPVPIAAELCEKYGNNQGE